MAREIGTSFIVSFGILERSLVTIDYMYMTSGQKQALQINKYFEVYDKLTSVVTAKIFITDILIEMYDRLTSVVTAKIFITDIFIEVYDRLTSVVTAKVFITDILISLTIFH